MELLKKLNSISNDLRELGAIRTVIEEETIEVLMWGGSIRNLESPLSIEEYKNDVNPAVKYRITAVVDGIQFTELTRLENLKERFPELLKEVGQRDAT